MLFIYFTSIALDIFISIDMLQANITKIIGIITLKLYIRKYAKRYNMEVKSKLRVRSRDTKVGTLT